MSIVYVLTNPAMPSLVKIGFAENEGANTRIAALYSTGVPVPFTIEFAAKVAVPYRVEEALHVAFAPYRVNPRREFVRIEPDQAIANIEAASCRGRDGRDQGAIAKGPLQSTLRERVRARQAKAPPPTQLGTVDLASWRVL